MTNKLPIFVFGSNRQGRHGAGAALYAVNHHGAKYGQARGRQGNSYAIVTKELRPTHPPVKLNEVWDQVEDFRAYVNEHWYEEFQLTKIGCGLAGFAEQDIAPMFNDFPSNVIKPEGW